MQELITEYKTGLKNRMLDAAPLNGEMSCDGQFFTDARGRIHVFVKGAGGCNVCSLSCVSCNGARCGGVRYCGERDDGLSGYFRATGESSSALTAADKKVRALLADGIGCCSTSCPSCGLYKGRTCPQRILLQTFDGDQAWYETIKLSTET